MSSNKNASKIDAIVTPTENNFSFYKETALGTVRESKVEKSILDNKLHMDVKSSQQKNFEERLGGLQENKL